jgi:hypothetical protein
VHLLERKIDPISPHNPESHPNPAHSVVVTPHWQIYAAEELVETQAEGRKTTQFLNQFVNFMAHLGGYAARVR